MTLTPGPMEQRIIPGAIQFLRDNGVALAAAGSGSFVGSLYVECPDSDLREIHAGGAPAGAVRIFAPDGLPGHSWAAYGVIDDGGAPGLRTGDGAYIETEKRPHPRSG